MQIAILSGKGGVGKTFVSTNLAAIIAKKEKIVFFDNDVEEPNSHLFFKGKDIKEEKVNVIYPVVDENKCDLCGECGKFCQFGGILVGKKKVIVIPQSCHGCGGCKMVCSRDAIEYTERDIGKIIERDTDLGFKFYYGILNIGELAATDIIKDLRAISNEYSQKGYLCIIDSPPGTSCSAYNTVEGVDFAVLVSEPTPFGISDMKLVIEMLKELDIKFGVVINRANLGSREIYDYLNKEGIPILGEINFDKLIVDYYSKGELISTYIKSYNEIFTAIYNNIKELL